MFRIIQGDVGSGKTIVSLLAIFNVIKSGYQCALMSPTEILAKQHFELSKTSEHPSVFPESPDASEFSATASAGEAAAIIVEAATATVTAEAPQTPPPPI